MPDWKKTISGNSRKGSDIAAPLSRPMRKAGSSRGEQRDGEPHSAIGKGKSILSSGWYILEHVPVTLVLRGLHFHGRIYQMQAKIKKGRESFSQTYA